MNVAEFLEWPGDGVTRRFQLIDGEVVAMSPASFTHGIIQATLARLIGNRLAETGGRCVLATEPAVVPRVRASLNMRVPDLGVSCAPASPGQIEMPDPVLLIEVLSPGNARVTRANLWAYATIPSVQELLLVQSTRIGAELLRRGPDGSWPAEPEQVGEYGALRLGTVDLTCPLRDIYAGTHLA
jgi:Uma2 family endonuclease